MQLCVIFRHVKALVLSSVFIPALVTSGEVFQFVAFCQRYPSVLLHIMSFSLASAIGQVGYLLNFTLQSSLLHKWMKCYVTTEITQRCVTTKSKSRARGEHSPPPYSHGIICSRPSFRGFTATLDKGVSPKVHELHLIG